MKIDHIFIFSSNKGQEVDELLEFGLIEGSGRTHAGIGTINRRIVFDVFYLEILWVQNQEEAKTAQSVGILERSNFKDTHYSPFGLCLADTENHENLFQNAIHFQPDFLPKGKYIEIITNERMPWIFKFPSTGRKPKAEEPMHHKVGLKKLTNVTFNLKEKEFTDLLDTIENDSSINFEKTARDMLTLEFDYGLQGKSKTFECLNLEIHF